MPLFEFRCNDCQHHFTMLVSNGEKSNAVCPKCGSGNLKQLITSFFTGGHSGSYRSGTGSCSCSTSV